MRSSYRLLVGLVAVGMGCAREVDVATGDVADGGGASPTSLDANHEPYVGVGGSGACGTPVTWPPAAAKPGQCPAGETVVESLDDSVALETLEGALGSEYLHVGAGDWYLLRAEAAFHGHFVRTRGRSNFIGESRTWQAATLECIEPRCTSDGSGSLSVSTSGELQLDARLGDDDMLCSVTEPGDGNATTRLRWVTLGENLELTLSGFRAGETRGEVSGKVTIALHDVELDGAGGGESRSVWSATCAIAVSDNELVAETDDDKRYHVTGSAQGCRLSPNGEVAAHCGTMLDELQFAVEMMTR